MTVRTRKKLIYTRFRCQCLRTRKTKFHSLEWRKLFRPWQG